MRIVPAALVPPQLPLQLEPEVKLLARFGGCAPAADLAEASIRANPHVAFSGRWSGTL
jgi:hypothetical protein